MECLRPHESPQRICRQWRLGRCYRLPCPFLHPSEDVRPSPPSSSIHRGRGKGFDLAKTTLCRFRALGRCHYGDSCRFLHSWCVGESFSFVVALEGHHEAWDLTTLQCVQTLTGHTAAVTSVLYWNQYLFSSSLDKKIKVWAATESGSREVTYTRNAEHGVLVLSGTRDLQGKPVLMCAFDDNTVRLCDLPSLVERGKLLSKDEIRSIQSGPYGLFFTGDCEGKLKAWK